MALKKREFTPESGTVDTYVMWIRVGIGLTFLVSVKIICNPTVIYTGLHKGNIFLSFVDTVHIN